MLCQRRFVAAIALVLLMGGLLAGCEHRREDQPYGGQRPTRDGGGGAGGY